MIVQMVSQWSSTKEAIELLIYLNVQTELYSILTNPKPPSSLINYRVRISWRKTTEPTHAHVQIWQPCGETEHVGVAPCLAFMPLDLAAYANRSEIWIVY